MGQALCSAPAGHRVAFCYERRRPEETTLYQVVQEQIATFLAQVEAKTGAGLPEFVKDEFEAYLECGILAHGFLRVRCADCAHEKLVAFSCKRRVPGRSGHPARAGAATRLENDRHRFTARHSGQVIGHASLVLQNKAFRERHAQCLFAAVSAD